MLERVAHRMIDARPQMLIIGARGHARAVVDVVEGEARYRIAGLIDSFQPAGAESLGYRILGAEADVPALCGRHGIAALFVAIGDNYQRLAMMERLRAAAPGIEFATCIHPQACVSSAATLGAGTVMMPGAIVMGGSMVGEGCVLNTGSSLDHDSVMEDGATLAPGARTGGYVHLGRRSYIGMGAVITPRCRIGADTVIGAGSVVLGDVPERVVSYGVPACVVRSRNPADSYL